MYGQKALTSSDIVATIDDAINDEDAAFKQEVIEDVLSLLADLGVRPDIASISGGVDVILDHLRDAVTSSVNVTFYQSDALYQVVEEMADTLKEAVSDLQEAWLINHLDRSAIVDELKDNYTSYFVLDGDAFYGPAM